jgi:hypothetical protein
MSHSSHSSHSSHNQTAAPTTYYGGYYYGCYSNSYAYYYYAHSNYVPHSNHNNTVTTTYYFGDYLNTPQYFSNGSYTALHYQHHNGNYSYENYNYTTTDHVSSPVTYIKYYGVLGAGHSNSQLISASYVNHVNYHSTGHTNTGSSYYDPSTGTVSGTLTNIGHVNTYQRNEFYQNKIKPVITWKYLGPTQVEENHGINRALVEIKDKLNLIRFTSAGTAGTKEIERRRGEIISHALEPNNTDILWQGISQFETFRNNILKIKKDLTGITDIINGAVDDDVDTAIIQTLKDKIDSISNVSVISNYYSVPHHSNSPHNNHFNHNNYNNTISYASATKAYYVSGYGIFYTNHSNSNVTTSVAGAYNSAYTTSTYKIYGGKITNEGYIAYNPGPAAATYHGNHVNSG